MSIAFLYRIHQELQQMDFKALIMLFVVAQRILIMLQSRSPKAIHQRQASCLQKLKSNDIIRQIHTIIDKSVAYKIQRWSYLSFFYLYVLYRFYIYQYLGLMFIIGLYVIYLIVQYFTPSGLPDPDEDSDSSLFLQESVAILTSTEGDRPVLRSLNEFNLWKSLCLVGFISYICTWFDIFLIPVYWPFLLIYFTWLIGLAVVKHCIHMRKYGYKISDFNLKKSAEI